MNVHPWQAQLMAPPPKAQASTIFTDPCRFFGWPPLVWGEGQGRKHAFEDLLL